MPFCTQVPIIPNSTPQIEAQVPQIYPDDVMLVSYPRSGNTWVRFLLANLMSDSDRPLDFVEMEGFIPAIHSTRQWERIKSMASGRFIKSHMPYQPDYKKVIYIVRDGRDVAVSHWHYHCPRNFEVSFLKFLKLGIWPGPWHKHTESWLNHSESIDFLMVKYEDLLQNPTSQLKRMIEFLSIPLDEKKIQKTVEFSSFNSLQTIESEKGHPGIKDENFKFFRKGTSGDWENHFGDEEKAFFKHYANPVLLRLGYIDTPDW